MNKQPLQKVQITTKDNKTDVYVDGERVNKITELIMRWEVGFFAEAKLLSANVCISKIVDAEIDVPANVNETLYTHVGDQMYKLTPVCWKCGSTDITINPNGNICKNCNKPITGKLNIGDIINFKKSDNEHNEDNNYFKGKVVETLIDASKKENNVYYRVYGIENVGVWNIDEEDLEYCPEDGEYYDKSEVYYY